MKEFLHLKDDMTMKVGGTSPQESEQNTTRDSIARLFGMKVQRAKPSNSAANETPTWTDCPIRPYNSLR